MVLCQFYFFIDILYTVLYVQYTVLLYTAVYTVQYIQYYSMYSIQYIQYDTTVCTVHSITVDVQRVVGVVYSTVLYCIYSKIRRAERRNGIV